MRTPERKRNLIGLAISFWFTTPFVEAIYYYTEQSRGAYPVDADSISIPIFQFLIGWLAVSPFVALFVWWSLRSYPGSVSFFTFNFQLKILGGLSWLATVALLASSIRFGLQSFNAAHWTDVAAVLLECYLALCINGVLQTRDHYFTPQGSARHTENPSAHSPII